MVHALSNTQKHSKSSTVHTVWEWDFSVTPQLLWPQVADTDRFNREAGLPSVLRLPGALESSDAVLVAARLGFWTLRWMERGFTWTRFERFSSERQYLAGPVAAMRMELQLIPNAAGTRLRYEVEVTLRWPGFAPLLKAILKIGIRPRFAKAFQKAGARAAQNKTLPLNLTFATGGHDRMQARLQDLAATGANTKAVTALGMWLQKTDDFDLLRIRPYALTEVLSASRREALELCLHATKAGLLEMRWEPLCPLCRGPKGISERLDGLRSTVHCDACHIDFNTDLDRSVEVTFRVHPALRMPSPGVFCVGSPQRTPHILVRENLKSNTVGNFPLHLEPGRYRLRSPSLPGGLFLRAEVNGLAEVEIDLRQAGWSRQEMHLGLNPCIRLQNKLDQDAVIIWERMAYADDAATAADVLCLQAFQDLFGSETLRPGEEIAVGNLAFLFTDLKGSTRLYREVGDAKAFALVMQHFAVLQECITEAGGTIVKTIGDAVMAAFTHPEAAVQAAMRAQQKLRDVGSDLILKTGVHCGSCIAVTQNERLDYFGSTLNMAARLVGFCHGGDLVLTTAVSEDPGVAHWMETFGGDLECYPLAVSVRGFEGETHRLLRIVTKAKNTLVGA
jgi:class 3 adenylate cyclase